MSAKRDWMHDTNHKFAYKCLPMTIANKYGWNAVIPCGLTAEWNGGETIKDMIVTVDDPEKYFVRSMFGHGILTFMPDFIIKTNQAISMMITGVPNYFKDGIAPMSGIVETDWLPYPFTMSYKFTKPGKVRFEKGEPIFSMFPISRGFIESFDIINTSLDNDQKFKEEYLNYEEMKASYFYQKETGFLKLYMNGKIPNNEVDIDNHITNLVIQDPREE